MKSRSKKDEEKKTIQTQVLRKLESIEKRIEEIEQSLKRIDKSSILTTEDQLFFGFVFSLVLLVIALPEFDVCTLFESFGVVVKPTKAIITTKMVLVILLMLSSGTRYLTALIKKDPERNKWRMVSVSFLIASFYFLIFDLTIRGLAAVLISINVFLIFLGPLTLSVIAIPIGFLVEKKWYRAYGHNQAIVSAIFGSIGLVIVFAYYVGMITSLFIPITDLVITIILFASIFITYLTSKFFGFLYKRLKTPNKTKSRIATGFGMNQVKGKIRELFLSKWFWYGLFFLVLFGFGLSLLLKALEGGELESNFLAEVFGLLFTLVIFVMFFDLREKLEWKSVEDRVKQRISRQIRGLFIDLSGLCVIDRVVFGPFSKEKFEEMDLKQLNKLASEDVTIHDEAKKSLLKNDFRMQYRRLIESRATSIGKIEERYFRFLDSDVQASLMDIQDHLDNLSYVFVVPYAKRERFFESISSSIGEIMKEIDKLRRKGYWTIRY